MNFYCSYFHVLAFVFQKVFFFSQDKIIILSIVDFNSWITIQSIHLKSFFPWHLPFENVLLSINHNDVIALCVFVYVERIEPLEMRPNRKWIIRIHLHKHSRKKRRTWSTCCSAVAFIDILTEIVWFSSGYFSLEIQCLVS